MYAVSAPCIDNVRRFACSLCGKIYDDYWDANKCCDKTFEKEWKNPKRLLKRIKQKETLFGD